MLVFHDLDGTLQALLERELPPTSPVKLGISFARPDGSFPPSSVSLPTINLFLYEIAENHELRTFEPDIERNVDGRATRVPAPARVDCHYLVTAWVKESSTPPDSVQQEHDFLGKVMRVLLRHREIPREALRGSLESQPYPVRAKVSPPSAQQSRGDFWQALGGKPRAAFHYMVTIAVDVHETEDIGKLTLASRGPS